MIELDTLSDRVYKRLLAMIMAGELPMDRPLREIDLAARLGVSRTPVREALLRLGEYGIVETKRNRSAVVRRLGSEELVHIHEVREALEGMAVGLACGRLTEADFAYLEDLSPSADEGSPGYAAGCRKLEFEFHGTLARRSGNPILAREIIRLHHLVMLFHDQRGITYDPEHMRRGRQGHLAVLATIKGGDREASRQAMIGHVRMSLEFALSRVPDGPPASPGAKPREAVLTE
jgi:DNA-binding GntR family transcriptional regulator